MRDHPLGLQPLSPLDLLLGGVVAAVVTGIWFTGDFHGMHDGDSLVHPLNSLYRWTVFVWEYDHNGSLLSLLTQVITRPYSNVLAISTLSSFLFLFGLALWGCLIAQISLTESSLWVSIFLPIALTMVAIFQIGSHSVTSGVALFMSGGFVFVLRGYLKSGSGGLHVLGMFALAFLATYLSKIAFIPMAAVACGLVLSNWPLARRKLLSVCACLLLALLAYQALEQISLFRKDYTLHLPSIPFALPRLLENWGSKAMTGIAWLAAPALMLLYAPTRRNPIFLSLCAGVVLQTLIISSSRWAAFNAYAAYYLFDLSFLSLLASIGLAADFLRRWPNRAQVVAVFALILAAIGLNGLKWQAFRPDNPFDRMEYSLGINTSSIVAAQCDLIIGDYWTAWPAMLAVNDYYFRNHILDPGSDQPRKIFAITYLAASTEHLWRPILERPDARLCSLASDDASYRRYLNTYASEIALQTIPAAEYGRVIVHQVRPFLLRSVTLEFDSPLPGKGWSYQEVSPWGDSFTWMDAPDATIFLPLTRDSDFDLEFRANMAMAPDILESLTLKVNDQPVQLNSTADPGGGTVFQGIISQASLSTGSGATMLSFHIRRTLIPQFTLPYSDDPRTLGLAFDWLRVESRP